MSISQKNWIEFVIKKPNALYKALKVKAGENNPENKIEKTTYSKNKLTERRVKLAETLKKFH